MAIQRERHYTQDLLKPIETHYDDLAFTTDNEGLVIHVDLYNGTETAAIGGSVAGAVICPDGSTVALVGTSSGNTATVAVNSDCVAIAGQITVNIQIVTGTIKTTVFTGKYNVLPFETNNPVDPGSRVTLAIGDLVDAIDEAVASIPPDYGTLTQEVDGLKSAFETYGNTVNEREVIDFSIVWDATSSGKSINSSGAITTTSGMHYSEYLFVIPGLYEYSLTVPSGNPERAVRIHGYDTSKTYTGEIISKQVYAEKSYVLSFTVTDAIKYIRISTIDSPTEEVLQYITGTMDGTPEYYRIFDADMMSTLTEYKDISVTTGEEVTAQYVTHKITGFLSCYGADVLKLSGSFSATGANASIAFYDASKAFLKAINLTGASNTLVDYMLAVPSGVDYFRIAVVYQSGSETYGQPLVISKKVTRKGVMFVAPDGNDANDGYTVAKPMLTIQKAIDAGAEMVVLKPGVYSHQTIDIVGIHGLSLICSGEGTTDPTLVDDHARKRLARIDNSIDVTGLEANGTIYRAALTLDSNSNYYKVFISQTLDPVYSASDYYAAAETYNAVLWEITGDVATSRYLKPVLSSSACTSTEGSFYCDGTYIYVHPFGNTTTGKTFKRLYIENDTSGIRIRRSVGIHLDGIGVDFFPKIGVALETATHCGFNNCECRFTSYSTGFRANGGDIVFESCTAYRVGVDGFSANVNGNVCYYNCSAYYCNDDGISHHDACTGVIDGGEFAYCIKGGVSPAYGSDIEVRNIYSHHNKYGIGYIASDSRKTGKTQLVTGCVLENNKTDIFASYYNLLLNACKYASVDYSDHGSIIDHSVNRDGTYPDLTAGNAEQLLSTTGVTDKVPYLFRPSAGDGADREQDKLVGGTVAWNQALKELNSTNFVKSSNSSSLSFDNGVATLNAAVNYGGMKTTYNVQVINGHKYFISVELKVTTAFSDRKISINTDSGRMSALRFMPTNTTGFSEYSMITTATGDDNTPIFLWDTRSSDFDNIYIKDFMLFDLTQMFGSTIADYVYALETATTGAGVAWFRKLFPKPYYPYNAGELLSVNTSAHEMVGFNQWDEEWRNGYYSANGDFVTNSGYLANKNMIPVLPNALYHYRATNNFGRICWYDCNASFISTGTPSATEFNLYAPSNAHFMSFDMQGAYGNTYNHDICINLSNAALNGTYQPYVKRTYALDSDLTLRGVSKLDSGNHLYYDGDTYEAGGTVTRRYGIVDLGTLTWTYSPADVRFYTTQIPVKATTSTEYVVNIVCPKYTPLGYRYITGGYNNDNVCGAVASGGTTYFAFKNTVYTDAATFKTAMSGVYLVYELDTPTTETADTYQTPQILDPNGTEAYIDSRTVPIPVGHETFYPENLRAKVEGLPTNFSTLIAPTEASYTATQAYASGALFIANNILYKATASIANGATITPATNCQATTLAAVIAALA